MSSETPKFVALDSADKIRSPRLVRLYEIWTAARGDRMRPDLNDIDMLDHPADAKFWSISDVLEGGKDFHLRFVGTGIVDFLTADATAQKLSEVISNTDEHPFVTNSEALYRMVVETGKPVLRPEGVSPIAERAHLKIESLNVPLGSEDGRVKHVLTALDATIFEKG